MNPATAFIVFCSGVSGRKKINTDRIKDSLQFAAWGFNFILIRAIKLFSVCLLTLFNATAQDVEFTASAPPVVEVGEQFRLTYSLNRQGTDLRLPDLADFNLISGPGTSSSSSVRIVNGQMTQTRSLTYTYTLIATGAGNYTIGGATIMVESDQYTSNPVEIEVVPDREGRRSLPGQQQSPDTPVLPAEISGEDLFVRILLDKNEVFQGEGVVATIKLYSKLDITGIENVRLPSFSGFFQQHIETPPIRGLDREVIDGEIYGTGVLRQMILFPQRSGELNIESFEMDALVRQRTGRRSSLFDDFFGTYETQRIPVSSRPLTLKVKPLPDQQPPGFTGAVGDYNMDIDADHGEIRTNEALSLRLTISGKGNLQLLGQPGIDFPPGFEVYDPGVTENIKTGTGGQEGSITYEYLMIPRSEGNFSIPPVEFSYFNPENEAFHTITTGELNLIVHRGEADESGPAVAGYTREDLRILGRDIRFIKTGSVMLKRIGDDPFGSLRFYLWYIVPLFVFVFLIIIQRKNIRDRSDIALMKNRRAGKMTRRRLRSAFRYLKENNHQGFFEEMLKACWGYLSDKLLIPVSDLNRENAKAALLERNVAEKDTGRLMEIIGECEFARYAPSPAAGDMQQIYRDTVKIITDVEQNIRQ